MHPKIHIFLGIIFIFFIHIFFPQISLIGLLIIFLSSILIDVDHYFYYILKKQNFNLLGAYKWFRDHVHKTCLLPLKERKKIYTGFYFFHGIEWLIILFSLGTFIHTFFMWIFIGFLFHMILDIPSEIRVKRTFHKFSLIYNYSQFKKLRRIN